MSFLRTLRAGPPPPKVALLPDALFFTRAVPVTAGATAADAATQVELALEAMSPFPLVHVYYGWYWLPGSEHALVFAAYRRRFTADQTDAWRDAELVLPRFATLFGAGVPTATTVVIPSENGLTAVHWSSGPVPTTVLFRPIAVESGEEERVSERDALLRSVGGSKTVIDLSGPPEPQPARTDREVVFRSGDFVSRIPSPVAATLDVRDKGELAALRGARHRDVLLWRLTVGAAAALLLLGLGELALLGGREWLRVRQNVVRVQQPLVDRIEGVAEQARRIEELKTKRLLPLEMVTILVGPNNERIPPDIRFTEVRADQSGGLYRLIVLGQTSNTAEINAYGAVLGQLPEVERVEPQITQTRGAITSFTLTVTFKPDAVRPVSPSA
jgi:hypothetical protein